MAFYINEQPIFAMMGPEMVPEYYQQRNPSRSRFQGMMVPEIIPEMYPEYYQPRNYSRRQFPRIPRYVGFVDELLEDAKEIEFEQNRSGFMNENDFVNAVALALNKNDDSNETSDEEVMENPKNRNIQNIDVQIETSESEDSDQEDKEYSENENIQDMDVQLEQNHSGSNMKTALLKAVALALAQEDTSNNSDERNIKNSKYEIIQNTTDKSIENQQNVEVATKKIKLANKIRINEDLEKMQIHIELIGYKFKGEHLDIRVFNEDILEVKAEDGDQKFEKQFKVPSKGDIENIESKFMVNGEENKQSLSITIPKKVKIVQVPIAMDED